MISSQSADVSRHSTACTVMAVVSATSSVSVDVANTLDLKSENSSEDDEQEEQTPGLLKSHLT